MLEHLCNTPLWNRCCAVHDKDWRPALAFRKEGKPQTMVSDPWERFFEQTDMRFKWDVIPTGKMDGRSLKGGASIGVAWLWFLENGGKIARGYFNDKWGGNTRKAMSTCGTYNALHADWLDYFERKREAFMEETSILMQSNVETLAKRGKLPQSHGGVANLLKVLTRTMKEQGSGIETIAKMQYAVCMQAGIYIIPEFLTDVLVADQIMKCANGGEENES